MLLLIMRPHAQDLDYMVLFEHLVDYSLLDSDPSGKSPCQVSKQSFIGRIISKRILSQYIQDVFSFSLQV